jgi:hypothetical protein
LKSLPSMLPKGLVKRLSVLQSAVIANFHIKLVKLYANVKLQVYFIEPECRG